MRGCFTALAPGLARLRPAMPMSASHSVSLPPVALAWASQQGLHPTSRSWLPLRQLSLLSFLSPPSSSPPVPTKPSSRQRYGLTWHDEYSWIEDETLDSLPQYKHEQKHLMQYFKGHRDLYSSVLNELRALETAARAPTPPERCGQFLYQSLPPTGAATNVTLLRTCRTTGARQVVLDDSLVAADLAAVWPQLASADMVVADVQLSKDQRWLAYTAGHHTGADLQVLLVRDLSTGEVVGPSCREGVMGMQWDPSGCLLHTRPDGRGRPYQVMRHALGAPAGEDQAVVEEASEAHFVGLGRTKDWAFATVNINSKTDSEVHLLGQQGRAPVCVQKRQAGLEYFVEHHHGYLYLLTNMGRPGSDYSLAACPAPGDGGSAVGLPGWQVVVPEREQGAVTDMDMFDGRCVLYEQRGALPGAVVLPLPRGGPPPSAAAAVASLQQVPLPAWATHLSGGANQDFHSSSLRLSCSSPIHPEATFDFDFDAQQLQHLDTQPAPAGHDPEDYSCQVLHASADDGAQVPITMVGRRNALPLQRDQQQQQQQQRQHQATSPAPAALWSAGLAAAAPPLVLQGYGAYGLPQETAFEAHRLALLSRGWMWAWAHGRGGGELGRRWHEAGRGPCKHVAISDYLACLQHLLAAGYAQDGRVAGSGFSAGGVLLGAALNHRPSAFAAAVLRAPFVDLLTVMTDPEQPLTVHEYDEWGGVDSLESVQQLRALCPYQNLQPQTYPPVLVSTAYDDTRVPWWGPVKYAARLRACQEGAAPVLLAIEEEGGHFAAAGHVQQLAVEYSFLLASLQSP